MSDGGVQELGNDLWHYSKSITTKVCSLIGCKGKAMFESSVDIAEFAFIGLASILLKFFYSNLILKINIYCVTCKLFMISKICSNFQVLSSHFSDDLF